MAAGSTRRGYCNAKRSHQHSALVLNPRAIRFGQSCINTRMTAPGRNLKEVDTVIDSVLQDGALPNWPPILAVEENLPSGDSFLRAVDGNRRLFIARIAWRRGQLGGVRVEICSKNDRRVQGRPWTETCSADGGHSVRSVPRPSRYEEEVRQDRDVQEDLHDFLARVAARSNNKYLCTILKLADNYSCVDKLHRLTVGLAISLDVPLCFWSDLQTELKEVSLLASELGRDKDGRGQVYAQELQPALGHLLPRPSSSKRQKAKPSASSRWLKTHCGDIPADQTEARPSSIVCQGPLKDARDGVLLKKLGKRGSTKTYEIDRASNDNLPTESASTAILISDSEDQASNDEAQLELSCDVQENVQVQVDISSAPHLAVIMLGKGSSQMHLVAVLADGSDPVRHAASIYEYASAGGNAHWLGDSGDNFASAVVDLPFAKIDEALSESNPVWAKTHWQLLKDPMALASGVGICSNVKGRQRAAKLALAIGIFAKGGASAEGMPGMPELAQIVERAARLFKD